MKSLAVVALLVGLLAAAWGQARAIQPGDRLVVTCSAEPSFGGEYAVDKDGYLRLPFVGPILVAGLTESAAGGHLTKAVRSKGWTGATLVARLIGRSDAPIAIDGAVESPAEIPFRLGMRLREVLQRARATAAADLERITITHADDKTTLVDATLSGPVGDPALLPGDRIRVPLATRPNEVLLLGAVVNPGSYPYKRGLTARQALDQAGGPGRHANLQRARILKRNGEEWPLDLSLGSRDIDLEPGDKIYLPVIDKQRFVSVIGAVAAPGPVEFSPGLTLRDAIASAGGYLPEADPAKLRVRRMVAVKDSIPGILEPFDIVEVPYSATAQNRFVKAAMNLARILLVFGR